MKHYTVVPLHSRVHTVIKSYSEVRLELSEVPSKCRNTALVIVPIVALIEDQIGVLADKGVAAFRLTEKTPSEIIKVRQLEFNLS